MLSTVPFAQGGRHRGQLRNSPGSYAQKRKNNPNAILKKRAFDPGRGTKFPFPQVCLDDTTHKILQISLKNIILVRFPLAAPA